MQTTDQRLYEDKRATKTGAYLCWLIGIHYLYLGKIGTWLMYFFTCGGFGIWIIIDIFRIPHLVEIHNLELKRKYNIED